jgi:hypothetical protein
MAQTYGNSFIKAKLGRTNTGQTPIAATLFCSLFGLLAFLGLADQTFNQVSFGGMSEEYIDADYRCSPCSPFLHSSRVLLGVSTAVSVLLFSDSRQGMLTVTCVSPNFYTIWLIASHTA